MRTLYVQGLTGTLMRLEEDPDTRYRFEVWFDYTRRNMLEIREGTLLAVPNFGSTNSTMHLSVLEVVSVLPIHYGLGTDLHGFPGFVVEAAQSAYRDWEAQESESTEDTTKIRCLAIPTNHELVEGISAVTIGPETSIPMVGGKVDVLGTEMTARIVNLGVKPEEEEVIKVGRLTRDPTIDVLVRVEELLKVHFGIFGFTGAGKSNLVSTLISKVLTGSQPNKIVLFDLMHEYTTLLIDLLATLPQATVVALGDKTMPDSVISYLSTGEESKRAVRDLRNTTLLPKALKQYVKEMGYPLAELLKQTKIRIYRERVASIGEWVEEHEEEFTKGNMGNSRQAVMDVLEELRSDFQSRPFTPENVQDALGTIRTALQQNLTATAQTNLRNLSRELSSVAARASTQRPLPASVLVTIPELVRSLNSAESPGLYLVQAHDPDELREFAANLGYALYEDRRRSGQIAPLVSFIFDEADEFIPLQAPGTYARSSEIAMTLARRGRKFGLGIGIATQRVTYLNTSIMAQPHTYFVSKLPRKSDRERITDAFGIGEEMFRQTFKFQKGQWLLVSHDATGLDALPLPITVENANDRLVAFLSGQGPKSA